MNNVASLLNRPKYFIDWLYDQNILKSDAVALRVMSRNTTPKKGDRVGIRLNLNILKSTGETIQTIHAGRLDDRHEKNRGFFGGKVLAYARAVTLDNAYFNVNQQGRELVKDCKNPKFPIASVDGDLQAIETKTANCSGIEVSFNPKNVHLFTDFEGRSIRYAEEVTILGHRCYARGKILYHTIETAPPRAGVSFTQSQLSSSPHGGLLIDAQLPDQLLSNNSSIINEALLQSRTVRLRQN